MKTIILTLLSVATIHVVKAQTTAENQVRTLEQNEVQAILSKDTTSLRKFWSPDLMTNSSAGRVNIGRQVDFVKTGVIDYTSYTREIEQVRTEGDIVITMGKETVAPKGSTDQPGLTSERRITSVWMKQNGIWRLIARQTSEMCK